MLSNLNVYPVEWLFEEKISLKQRIAKLEVVPTHPSVGYRYPHAHIRHLHDRLEDINRELASRAQEYPGQAADLIRAFK